MGWSVNRRVEDLVVVGRLLHERTPEAARLRRRAIAAGGFGLMVAGFLAAVGLGSVVLLGLGTMLAVLVVSAAIPSALRIRRHVRVPRSQIASAGRTLKDRGRTILATRKRPRRAGRQHARRLNARGTAHRRSGEHRLAVDAHREALALLREAGDRRGEALTLNNLALALAHAGDDAAALDHFEEALGILRELGDEQREGQVFANLGLMHGRRGRREQALGCLGVALDKLDPQSSEYRRVEEQLRRAS